MIINLEIQINVLQQFAAAHKLPFATAWDKIKAQANYINWNSINN